MKETELLGREFWWAADYARHDGWHTALAKSYSSQESPRQLRLEEDPIVDPSLREVDGN